MLFSDPGEEPFSLSVPRLDLGGDIAAVTAAAMGASIEMDRARGGSKGGGPVDAVAADVTSGAAFSPSPLFVFTTLRACSLFVSASSVGALSSQEELTRKEFAPETVLPIPSATLEDVASGAGGRGGRFGRGGAG